MTILNKQFFNDKILPIIITAILSALISMLTNLLSAYTGATAFHTDPATTGIIGLSLKSIQHIG